MQLRPTPKAWFGLIEPGFGRSIAKTFTAKKRLRRY